MTLLEETCTENKKTIEISSIESRPDFVLTLRVAQAFQTVYCLIKELLETASCLRPYSDVSSAGAGSGLVNTDPSAKIKATPAAKQAREERVLKKAITDGDALYINDLIADGKVLMLTEENRNFVSNIGDPAIKELIRNAYGF